MNHQPPPAPCPDFHFGASYYPEQIDAHEVERDAQLMRAAGFNVARMGEFAWSRMEPDDGKFDFTWLENAVEILARHGVRSLLGTPTAAPPKWLTDKHPDICLTLADGRSREFGNRRHYCVNSVDYHDHTRRIVTALTGHFKDNPNIIGYQLDNEFMAEYPHCYCETCRKNFQTWLREKFGTIEELNRRWGMAFWSQGYRNFDEVVLPKTGHNPSALQDLYHFFSDSFVDYARLQTDCIRGISPDKTVTHNICSSGFLYLLDLHKLAGGLDIVSVDNYPLGWTLENEYGNAADGEYHPAMAGLALSMMRGLRRAPFWVTEAQTGRTFRPRRQLPQPGLIHVWTHQEIAHGAKAVIWFHWRQFPTGIEHTIHGVLECDGKPRRRYVEIQRTVREIQALAGGIADACPRPEVALLRDFHNDWALDDGHTHPDFRYQRHLYLYYRALFENHVNADVIHPTENLAGYKLVIAPSLLLVDEQRAVRLREYVEQGGTLVLTVQSGLRDFDNAFHRGTLPAHMHAWCGIEIEEQNALPGTETTGIAPLDSGWSKARYECQMLFEIIQPTTARPLFHYTDHWFAGTPAITVNRFGKGTVYYIATMPPPEFAREWLAGILPECSITPNVAGSSSSMVESVKSINASGEILHLINYTGEPQTVTLHGPYRHLADSQAGVVDRVDLEPFGAAVLQRADGQSRDEDPVSDSNS